MEYFESNQVNYDFINMFSCYDPIPVSTVLGTRCIGTGPQSPTTAPTQAPTSSPTADTISPTPAPTMNPSTAPTLAPTFSPSLTPTNAPSFTPSIAPSDAPSLAPSLSPSIAPSNLPTNSPSSAPTPAPTGFPTFPLTQAPSDAPINSPTYSPSLAPSFSPSTAPTNNPISAKDFKHFISITYELQNVNDENKVQIINDPFNETRYIKDVIKENYFLDGFLSFENFLVSISDIQGVQITEIDTNTQFEWINVDTLSLNAQIDCNEDDDNINYCASIQQQSKKTNDFYDRVADDLRSHYNNQQIEFSSQNGNALIINCKDCEEEPPDYVLYGLAGIVGLIYLVALFALLFNMGFFPKLPGFNYVDNGNWVALMTIGLQFWFVHFSAA